MNSQVLHPLKKGHFLVEAGEKGRIQRGWAETCCICGLAVVKAESPKSYYGNFQRAETIKVLESVDLSGKLFLRGHGKAAFIADEVDDSNIKLCSI